MRKLFSFLFILFISCISIKAQELNATVRINSDRIQSSNKNVFTTLERALNTYINETNWSEGKISLAKNERINCSFTVSILEQTENTFKSELFIQARRPVYNSTYTTQLLNFRDTKFDFEYTENAPIEYSIQIRDNLTATITFYCLMILGLDFDSFSPMGGSPYFRSAQNLAMQAQSNSGWTGWSSFDDNRSKTSIISAYMDESLKAYREYLYTYHRKGLDEMAANPGRARTTILNGLPVLKELRKVRNSEIILQMFSDCKLSEIVSLSSKANAEEKKDTYDLLRNVYPASTTQLEPLKK
jgi:hypothetical protein